MPDKRDMTADRIVRFFCGETLPDEQRLLRAWIARSPENRARFIGFRNVYLGSLTLCREAERTAMAERGRFVCRRSGAQGVRPNAALAAASQPVAPSVPAPAPPRMLHPLRYAAAAAVVLFGAGLWLGRPRAEQVVHPAAELCSERIEFGVSFGARASTTLPDGSRIRLNAGSRISYAPDFNEREREVRLEGEAYFDVRTDAAKPFVVRVRDLAIVATGTAFNVSAYAEDPAVTTTLVRGAVTIDGARLAEPIRIAPNQTVVCFGGENGRTAMARVLAEAEEEPLARAIAVIAHAPALRMEDDPLVRTSWKEERWVIERERLESLMARIERRYNVSVRFAGDRIRNYRFSGAFEGETIDEVLRIIRRALPVGYSIDKGVVHLFPDEGLRRRFERAAERTVRPDDTPTEKPIRR